MSQATCLGAPPDACPPGRVRPATLALGLPSWGYATWLGAAVDRLARPGCRRVAIRDLHRLGDRELRDIGIDRGEIDSIVDEMLARRLRTR